MADLPFVAFGNDELQPLPLAPEEGGLVECPCCHHRHGIHWGRTEDGSPTRLLGAVSCVNGESYLVAVAGKLLASKEASRG